MRAAKCCGRLTARALTAAMCMSLLCGSGRLAFAFAFVVRMVPTRTGSMTWLPADGTGMHAFSASCGVLVVGFQRTPLAVEAPTQSASIMRCEMLTSFQLLRQAVRLHGCHQSFHLRRRGPGLGAFAAARCRSRLYVVRSWWSCCMMGRTLAMEASTS